MHWLLISARHGPQHGGIGASVRAFVEMAVAAGWRVDLVTRAGDEMPGGARIVPVTTPDMHAAFGSRIDRLRAIERIRPYRAGQWALGVAEALRGIDGVPDAMEVVDCQAEGLVALTCPALRARFARTPALVHVHTPMFVGEAYDGADVRRFGRRVSHGWERRTLAAADGLLAPSRRALACVRDHVAADTPTLVVPPPLADVPPEGGAGAGILFVGGYQALKGPDVLCRALRRLLPGRPGLTARFVGPDTPTGPGGASVRATCAALLDPALRSRCTFDGPVDAPAVATLVRRAAVVVVPSRHESYSMVASDAIARGRPVVVSDAVGLAEHLPRLGTFPSGDDAALARAIGMILDAPAAALAHARALRDELRATTTPERLLDARAAFARRVAETRTCPRRRPAPFDGARMRRYLSAVEAREQATTRTAEAVA